MKAYLWNFSLFAASVSVVENVAAIVLSLVTLAVATADYETTRWQRRQRFPRRHEHFEDEPGIDEGGIVIRPPQR